MTKKRKLKTCARKGCNKQFEPRAITQLFCSGSCQHVHYHPDQVKQRKYKTIKLRNGLEVIDNVFGMEMAGVGVYYENKK